MINYNEYDIEVIDNYFQILNKLNVKLPEDDEVWNIARQYKEIPNLDNIYISIVFNRLEEAIYQEIINKGITTKEVSINKWINARDSKFYVNDNITYTYEDLMESINEDTENWII